MAAIEGARARQRFLPDHAQGLQSGARRVFRMVPSAAERDFHEATVAAWRVALAARGLGAVSINVRITAVRKLAVEAVDNGLLAP